MLVSLLLLDLTGNLEGNQVELVKDIFSGLSDQLELGSVDVISAGHNDLGSTSHEILGDSLDDLWSFEEDLRAEGPSWKIASSL